MRQAELALIVLAGGIPGAGLAVHGTPASGALPVCSHDPSAVWRAGERSEYAVGLRQCEDPSVSGREGEGVKLGPGSP